MVEDARGSRHRPRGAGGGRFEEKTGTRPSGALEADAHPELLKVLESAARLQELVPDAVLVGGSAAALYGGHRLSLDHDHMIGDLRGRFDMVLEALESDGEFVLNRVRPGKLILGRLGDIETGVRQLIRTRPLETSHVILPSGRQVTVPTREETLRIKAYLIVKRNQVRDYLDVAALADRFGTEWSANALNGIDYYYRDETKPEREPNVRDQLMRQLADPQPADHLVLESLPTYKGLGPRWHRWDAVVDVCQSLSVTMEVA